MLSIRFDMPLWLMGLYGGIMAVCVLLLRLLLGRHLPKRVFPVLWAVVLIRLFVPFSISSPLSLHIPMLGEGDSGLGTLWPVGQEAVVQSTVTTTYLTDMDPLLLNSASVESGAIDQEITEYR